MKYIKKVILENFQSHKYTTVDFDNRLNVIVGPSDSGKTAILRGIRWALYNDPSGDYFIKEGESECSVTIVFNDNIKIKRYRSKSKNIYYLYDELDNELKFEGFGVSVPEEIIEATGIKKILLDKNIFKSINISDQLEGAFLLSEKGSVRASSIGYLVGVDIVDDALKELLRESRNLSNNKRSIDDNIRNLEKELSEYEYLKELDTKVKKLEITLDTINKKEENLFKYKKLLSKTSNIDSEKISLKNYTNKLSKVSELEIVLNKIELKYIQYKQMNKQMTLLKTLKSNINKNIQIVNSLKDIEKIKYNLDKISLLNTRNEKLIGIRSKFKNNYKEIKYYEKINSKFFDLNVLQKKLTHIERNITKFKELSQIKNEEYKVRKSLSVGYIYVDKLKGIDRIAEKYNKIYEELNVLNSIMKLSSNFKNNKKMILITKKKLNKYKDEFDIISDKYKDLLLETDTCPLCFSNIDAEKVNYIVDQYK